MTYYLAIDIGASSGRHILGWLENETIRTEEVYRFENGFREESGALVWDTEALLSEVVAGIGQCKKLGKIPKSIAIDTWGVDYVLLDKENKMIAPAYCYRDERGANAIPEVEEILSPRELYSITGIQKMPYNSIYQLYADKRAGRLENAECFLMIPEYLSYRLTGAKGNEYTNASTTGLLNAKEYGYDASLIEKLGLPERLFGPLMQAGDSLGKLLPEIQEQVGFSAEVRFCASHDTGSAVVASPLEEHDVFISSGTWSLIGTELKTPILTEEAWEKNYSHEGGVEKRFRFLKNYMGMWLFQNIRKNLNKSMTYDEMMTAAEECGVYYRIDVNAPEFVAPDNMIDAIRIHLGMPELPLAQVINSVYHSLAMSYADAVKAIEQITGFPVHAIRIVGGGSKDVYLNRLTAQYTGRPVTAGPVEATALGNLLCQILADKPAYTLQTGRDMIKKSFEIKEIRG
ncbi:MAG: rhamnulokinase [Clostridia bacterium]|nr:rhamnulokinase [Clostridia bacterium]